MPRTKSAKKALKQARKRRLHNLKIKNELKSLKKAAILSLTKKEKTAPEKVEKAIITIDKAAKRNIIHKNKAARLKSKLTKKLNELKMVLPKRAKKAQPAKKTKPTKKIIKKKMVNKKRKIATKKNSKIKM